MATLKPVDRPPEDLVQPFRDFGTATISSALREVCGILRHSLTGPVAFTPGLKAVGTAVTLSFMAKREDVIAGHAEEEQEKRSALWSAVIATQDGDVLVVDARGNMQTGCLGAMLMTSIHAKGTRGLVVDGCIRDLPEARDLGLPLFLREPRPTTPATSRCTRGITTCPSPVAASWSCPETSSSPTTTVPWWSPPKWRPR